MDSSYEEREETRLENYSFYVNEDDEDSDSSKNDESVLITDETISTMCPFTQKTFVDPVKNNICGHSYERSVINDLIRSNKGLKSKRCPYIGCSNMEPISLVHIKSNDYLKNFIETSQAQHTPQKVIQIDSSPIIHDLCTPSPKITRSATRSRSSPQITGYLSDGELPETPKSSVHTKHKSKPYVTKIDPYSNYKDHLERDAVRNRRSRNIYWENYRAHQNSRTTRYRGSYSPPRFLGLSKFPQNRKK
jgi:hypothetical protein